MHVEHTHHLRKIGTATVPVGRGHWLTAARGWWAAHAFTAGRGVVIVRRRSIAAWAVTPAGGHWHGRGAPVCAIDGQLIVIDPDPDDTDEAVEVGQLVGGEVERAVAFRQLRLAAEYRLVDARRRAGATVVGGTW